MMGHWFKHWSLVPEGFWPENFHPRTDPMLVSPDTGEIYFDIESFQALQRLRDNLGPLRLFSGYRSRKYNARIGGAPRSQHSEKIAFDLAIGNLNVHAMAIAAREAGFTGLGYYPSRGFLHVDRGRSRFWYGSQKDKKIMLQSVDIVV